MKKTGKKGFTIVELVIVIAVVAILAAVLIPTFVSITKKANESVDIQACRQMNTHLATKNITNGVDNITDVIKALNEENIDLDNYKPLTSGRMFYWYKTANRILYVDENNSVLFPEEYKSLDLSAEKGTLFSLNGEIKFKDYTITEENGVKTVSVTSGGQFASFINNYNSNNGDAKSVSKITLREDIDLFGATYKFVGDSNENGGFNTDIEIDGNNHAIYGFRDDTNSTFGSGEFAKKGYYYGLFSSVGKNAIVTLKNVTLSGMNIEDSVNEDTGTLGLIAGRVYGTLKLDNVTIENSYICGSQKVGAIAGWVSGNLEMNDLTLKNVKVEGALEVAKLVGFVTGSISVNNVNASENVTVDHADKYDVEYMTSYLNYTKHDEDYVISEFDSSKLSEATGMNQNGKIYMIGNYPADLWSGQIYTDRYYIYSCITEDYFWQIISSDKRCITIDEKPCYWYAYSTSESI